MNKKYTLWISVCFTMLLLLSSAPAAKATVPTSIPNKGELTIASIGIPDTLDPQWLYDTSSAEVCIQVYDTLIGFDWEDPATFTPKLATNWYEATPETGYAMKVVFEMKTDGVEWHNGHVSDGADLARHAEYTFERWMALDRSGGPTWMIFEALFGPGNYHIWDVPDTINSVNAAVERSGNLVWFNFMTEYPLAIFYQVVAQSWAGIINAEWAAAQGAWNGVYADWEAYYDPPYSPFDEPDPVMMGTGPYMGPPFTDPEYGSAYMDYIAEMWRLIRHRNYWQGWPAPGCSRYLNAVKQITMYDFFERKLWFLSNDPAAQADLIYIPRANINDPDLLAAIDDGSVRYIKDLPVLGLDAVIFNFDIPDNSPYAGDFTWTTGIPKDFFTDADTRYAFAYAFDWDKYITEVYLGEATQPATPLIKGLGYDDFYDSLNPALQYYRDEDKCRTHLQNAWVGTLWDEGFTMTITYNEGNVAGRVAAETLEENIEAFNAERPGKPPFNIDVLEVIWDTYREDLINYPYFRAKMPLWINGWLADYPDPHNFFHAFMHTYGTFAYFQSYSNPAADMLMEAEITETGPPPPPLVDWYEYESKTKIKKGTVETVETIDFYEDNIPGTKQKLGREEYQDGVKVDDTYGRGDWDPAYANPVTHEEKDDKVKETGWFYIYVPSPRETIFADLMAMWYTELPSLPLVQPLGRHYERTWVQGWYYNPIYGGSLAAGFGSTAPATPVLYFRHLWKGLDGDIDGDGTVGLGDAALMDYHWYPPEPPKGEGGYNRIADIYPELAPDGRVDDLDLDYLTMHWGDTEADL